MQHMTLTPATKQDFGLIRCLYHSAFPPEERAPFFFLKRRALQGRGELLVIRDGERFVGFAALICHADLVYLFFFAIDASLRGIGYGSATLTALKQRYVGKRLFLARESLDEHADNYEQRVRRHAFYRSNGFEDLPIRIKEASMVYDVMGIGGSIGAEEYDALMTSWCGSIVRRLVDLRLLEK